MTSISYIHLFALVNIVIVNLERFVDVKILGESDLKSALGHSTPLTYWSCAKISIGFGAPQQHANTW
jgi:hypothetical protein